jgi:hypothetical protein
MGMRHRQTLSWSLVVTCCCGGTVAAQPGSAPVIVGPAHCAALVEQFVNAAKAKNGALGMQIANQLVADGCDNPPPLPKPSPPPLPSLVETTPYTPAPIELTTADGGDVETGTGVVPPGPGCPEGGFVVSSGSKFRLISRTLPVPGAPAGQDPAKPPFNLPWPDFSPYLQGGWDNQLARLANGDLLLFRAGGSQVPVSGPQPSWWSSWFGQPNPPFGQRNGFRSALVLWRSSCGGGGFSRSGVIDAGTLGATDRQGKVQMGYCAQGWPGNGGFDRPEIYVDPWGLDSGSNAQRVFASTRCTRFDDDAMDVFVSNDSGATWQPSTIRLPGWEAVVMTSTASGRFFLFQCNGATPTLYYSDDHGRTLASATGWDVSFTDAGGQAAMCTWPPGAPFTDPAGKLEPGTGAGQPAVTDVTMVRIADDAVLVGYPAIEQATDSSGSSFERGVEEIVLVTTFPASSGTAPTVQPVTTIRSAGPRGSVLQATFIADERPLSGPRLAMLYWVETDDLPAGGRVGMHARYSVFRGALDFDSPRLLGSSAGWTETRTASQSRGDYMKGGFFVSDAGVNFAATWPESSQIHGRIITLAPAFSLPRRTARPALGTPSPKPACDDCLHRVAGGD